MAKLKQVDLNEYGMVEKTTTAKFFIRAHNDEQAYFGLRVSGPHSKLLPTTSQNPRQKGTMVSVSYMELLVGGPTRFAETMLDFIKETLQHDTDVILVHVGSRVRIHVIITAAEWALLWQTKFNKLIEGEISRFDQISHIERVHSFRRLMG